MMYLNKIKMAINKSPGVDEVLPHVLKECENIISVVLPDILNKSIASGDVPSLWRQDEHYSNL